MEDLKKALWEALKEPLRLLLLAAVPVLLTYFTGSDWKYAGLAILVLRFLDKVLYYFGKTTAEREGEEYKDVAWKGLIGF